jgi:type I restriction enzyme S subunit
MPDEPAPLPKGWKLTPFHELATFETGRTPPRAKPDYWAPPTAQGTPWVTIGDMRPYGEVKKTAERVTPSALRDVFRGRVSKKGTLIMSFKLTIGRVATLGLDACHNEAIISILPTNRVNQKFLEYFLSQVDYADYQDRAVKGNTLNQEKINRIAVAEPPKAEQENIASILWMVQQAIDAEDKLTATASELKQATMRQLFASGLRGAKQRETAIGPVPKHWNVVPLGSLGRIGNGSTPLKTNPAYWTNGTIPWLTSAKVYDVTITTADQFVTPLAAQECHLPRVKPGSVLVAITGQGKTLGHAAVTAIETCVSQHIAYLSFDQNSTNPHFIRLFLESRYTELRNVASGGGSTKGALTCTFFKTFPVPSPERDEQDAIASTLMAIEAKISIHERKRAALSDLFQTLLHHLMTAQIRVDKLDIDTSEVAA